MVGSFLPKMFSEGNVEDEDHIFLSTLPLLTIVVEDAYVVKSSLLVKHMLLYLPPGFSAVSPYTWWEI